MGAGELADALFRLPVPRASPSTGPEAVLDLEALERLLHTAGGDPEFVATLLDSFTDDTPAMVEQMRHGVASGDRDTVRRAAHTLKSNAATFGATALAALCADLGTAARTDALTDAQEAVRRIEAMYQTVSTRLGQWRATLVRA